MSNGELSLEDWIFGLPGEQRFTQDSPVLPEVWLRFSQHPDRRQDLLLTPHQDSSAANLMAALSERLAGEDRGELGLAYNEGYVVAYLDFHQLVRAVVPLSKWWSRTWPGSKRALDSWLRADGRSRAPRPRSQREGFRGDWLAWYLELVGRIESGEPGPEAELDEPAYRRAGAALLKGVKPPAGEGVPPLWSVNVNRVARTALWRSRATVKADAARRVFSAAAEGRPGDDNTVRWAVIDTGIDATHPAFRRRDDKGALEPPPPAGSWQGTRVLETYDFTRLRPLISGRIGDLPAELRSDLKRRIKNGLAVDWDTLAPLLRVEHDDDYPPPTADHGTHIAGIVAGDWRHADPEMPSSHDLIGICPEVELYDLRVFDEHGDGEEFGIIAALQFIRHLNSHSDKMVVHGANLSLSLTHVRTNFAVGRSPICEECERLTANGVVVVAAAGNEGQERYLSLSGERHDGFRAVAITDPGNAERVITVGSTHRIEPHAYGVSYFSSRGPTSDGRRKPDLLAPGEKITAPVPGGDCDAMDGTSQAAAHVSGVAAILIARYTELIGRPEEVKRVLCASATDLGREPDFQGAGLVDALRALEDS